MRLYSVILLAFFSMSAFASDPETYHYTFVNIEQNSFDKKEHESTAPEADYEYTVGYTFVHPTERIEVQMKSSSVLSYKEILMLMKYFHVNSVSELVGKTFSTPNHYAVEIDMMVAQAKNDFNYTAPTKEELYDRAVQALSMLRCPDFNDVDATTIRSAFQNHSEKETRAWFAKLLEDVAAVNGDAAKPTGSFSDYYGVIITKIQDTKVRLDFHYVGGPMPFRCGKKSRETGTEK